MVLVPLALALLAAPAAVLAGMIRTDFAAPAGATVTALAFGTALYGWLSGGGRVDVPWAPTLDLRFAVELDGLAALYTLLATGIGFLIVVYSARYIPLHLHHEDRSQEYAVRFHFFILLFMGSMVGLAMAQDLILIFLFWDLTAIASYYLIGYDAHQEESRTSALMALLVTGITAVLLLIGALMFYAAYGTFSVPELAELTEPGILLIVAGGLIAIAGLAKSAQVPFQFWLPRAMAAPTPVSAYLHSAAMVAAGVLLIGRVYPLLQKSEFLLGAFTVVGAGSILVGGLIALSRDVLKQLLAYSTISQYGYVVFMFGMGGEYGAMGASFYVIAHALAKSALFLTAGAVTEATGENQLSKLGGLAPRMPLLAASAGATAAGLAALPLTIGFFKDEMLFATALHEENAVVVGMALLAAILTLTYTWRFWSGIFLGDVRSEAQSIPMLLVLPIMVLGVLVLVGGVFVEPFEILARAAGEVSYAEPIEGIELAYHLDTRAENLLALATFGIGALVIISAPLWQGAVNLFARVGEKVGPERIYFVGLDRLNRFSTFVYRLEVQDTRGRVAAILVPAGVLVALGLIFTGTGGVYEFGGFTRDDFPLTLALIGASVASLATCVVRKHVTLVLVISAAGFSIAIAYAFFGAPDVALVAVLVETIITLIILGVLKLIPYDVLRRGARIPVQYVKAKAAVAVLAGGFMLAISWATLSQTAEESAAEELLDLTPEAHGKDAVTVILADFRGLDTMGEISVVALVLLGIATLLWRGRLP